MTSRRPPAITDAESAYADQHRARVRKYLLLMSLRIPALLIAWAVYAATGAAVVGAVIIVVSAPLSWMAVLIANDRPPRYRRAVFGKPAAPADTTVMPAVAAETVHMISSVPAGNTELPAVRGRYE